MAYQALYRKYRPTTFSEVVGQDHITQTLKNELASGKPVHAYLFTGTRGTGKTSCAKILAKAVNCLNPVNGDPCGECEMCRAIAEDSVTDITEIDAASNNGVDSIRELREQVTFTPAVAKYRVYIIDEVHMLSIGAFNALLKTLEEPPAHVVFILATTEVHKLPATILSRCQRFDFRRIESEEICERLHYIADKEGFNLTDGAATLIASAADGGMRDALSILDLCASNGKEINEDTVASACAMAGNDYLIKLADSIKNRDTEGALLLIDELHKMSVDMLRLLSELIEHYRNLMIMKTVKGNKKPIVCSSAQLEALEKQAAKYDIKEIMSILACLQTASASMQTGNRRCEMEMTLIKICNPEVATDIASLERRITALECSGVKVVPKAPVPEEKPVDRIEEVTEPSTPDTEEQPDEIPLPEPPDAPALSEGEVAQWGEVIEVLKRSCPIMAGVLNGSRAFINGQYLLIDTNSLQFKDMVNDITYRDAIRNAAKEVLGGVYKLGPYRKPVKSEDDPLAAFAAKLNSLKNK